MILIILLNVLYALMYTFSKFSLFISQPIFTTGVKVFLGGLFSLLVYVFYHDNVDFLDNFTFYNIGLIILISIFNVYFCNVLEIFALQHELVGKIAFMYNLCPFVTVLFSYIFFSHHITYKQWIGLGLGFLGFVSLFLENYAGASLTAYDIGISFSQIAIVGAVVSSVIGYAGIKVLLEKSSLSIFFINGITLCLGGILCCIHSFLTEVEPFIFENFFLDFIKITLLMAVIKYVIAFNLNLFLLKKYSLNLLSFFGFTASFFGAFFGYLFFGEIMSIYNIISGVLVLIGLIMFYQEELKQESIQR
jgi:drug/metabolite transporter (DMT)-like permease